MRTAPATGKELQGNAVQSTTNAAATGKKLGHNRANFNAYSAGMEWQLACCDNIQQILQRMTAVLINSDQFAVRTATGWLRCLQTGYKDILPELGVPQAGEGQWGPVFLVPVQMYGM